VHKISLGGISLLQVPRIFFIFGRVKEFHMLREFEKLLLYHTSFKVKDRAVISQIRPLFVEK